MQDDRRNLGIPYIIRKALLLAAFFFLAGCSRRDTEEYGIEELQLTEKTRQEDVKAGTKQTEETDAAGDDEIRKSAETSGETTVFVYVCGAVKEPGVYELDADARVYEAIQSAGGVTEQAAQDTVNQARVVTDGEQIYVPTEEEAAQGAGVGENTVTEGTVNSKVNINTAGKEELMTLTGIGEAKAESILKYRDENGKFGSIEELMEIEGIKEGVFGKIKDDITI